MKTKFMAGASALTLIALTPGAAFAAVECGVPNTAANPNVASCISDSTNYANGITYNQSNFGVPANLLVDVYSTVVVNSATDGVTVNGSNNRDAIIGVRGNARINAGFGGLFANTSGTGNATITNNGIVTVGGQGAVANAIGTGTASVVNSATGVVTVDQTVANGPIGVGLAITGQNGSVLNLGRTTVTSNAATGQTFGIGGVGLGGGTLSLTNANQLSVTTGAGDAVGIGTLPSGGGFALLNSGTLTVTAGSGTAYGFSVIGAGLGGTAASTLSNTGALSVTSGSGDAIGMYASDTTNVAMTVAHTGASSSFAVNGANVIGFQTIDVGGDTSVTSTGQAVTLAANLNATGVSLSGGNNQTVTFAPATVGGTTFGADLTVTAGSQATGVLLAAGNDAATVNFSGANLNVTSTGGGATGIAVEGAGAGVGSVDIAIASGNGRGGALTVRAEGGDAIGITTTNVNSSVPVPVLLRGVGIAALNVPGGESVELGETLNVTSTTGTATGVALNGGTAQSVALNGGAVVSGTTGALGVSLSNGTGALTLTSGGAFTVNGGAGQANGITLSGGTDQTVTVSGPLAVTGGNSAIGIRLENAQGNVAINTAGAFTVADTGNSQALGLFATGNGNVNATLGGGLTVTGGGFAGGAFVAGGGALSLTAAQDVTVTGGQGGFFGTFGTYMISGTAQTAQFDGNLSVTGNGGGFAVSQSGSSGAQTLGVAGNLTGINLPQGVVQQSGTTQTITVGGNLALTAATGDITGVDQLGASTGASLTVNGTFDVAAANGAATGVRVLGSNATVSLARGLTVTASGSEVTGIVTSLLGNADVTLGGALAVTDAAAAAGGTAVGLDLFADGKQRVRLADTTTVSADGDAGALLLEGSGGTIALDAAGLVSAASANGRAIGLGILGGTAQTVALTGGVTVNALNEAIGADISGGTGAATFSSGAISVTARGGSAVGLTLATGSSQAVTLGALTVAATGSATGATIGSGTGGAVTLTTNGATSVTSSGGIARGFSIQGATDQTVALNGAVTVRGAGDAYGVEIGGGSGTASVRLPTGLTVTSTGGTASGLSAANGGALTIADAGAIAVTGASTATGVSTTLFTGAQTVTLGNVTATAGTGTVRGVSLSGSGAITLADAGTITVAGQGGSGVSVTGTGATSAIGVTLGTVTATGAGVEGVNLAQTGPAATGALNATIGSVSTAGANANGVVLATTGGAQTLTAQTVAVTGAGSRGVVATSGTGAITATTADVSARAGTAIALTSGTGAITLTSTRASAAGADAIALTSTSGTVRARLAAGGATTSTTGAGLAITTGGQANVTLASGATLQGATGGLVSAATGGQTVTLAGTVGAGNNRAVALSGGAATLTNSGTINGFLNFATTSTTFTNAGTWNARGGDTTFAGNATLVNSGTIAVNAAATTATRMRLTNLTTLRNSGTISLVNGHTGDVLDLGSAAVVGSGNSRVVLEANLGAAAVGANAAQSADQLTLGAASGTTTIAITDLSGGTAAQFNFNGIRLVNAASSTAGAFVLEGGAINKGFIDYQLARDATGNINLVGVPSTQAFELVRTGAEVRRYWRRSGDAWSDQMRATVPQDGVAIWGQLLGGNEKTQSRPNYTQAVLGTPTTFSPNLDMRDTWFGGQLGVDWGHGDWSLGVTGGYVSQEGKVRSTDDRIKLDGGNVGIYARYRSADGFFAHALAKVDRYSVKYELGNGASGPKSNGTSYGVQVEAGYHVRSGSVFFEPSASASWTNADLDGFSNGSGGIGAKFEDVQSFYGRAGLRVGVETVSGGWNVQPYVGANYEGELNGQPGVTLTSGGQSLFFRDASEGGRVRFEGGVQGTSANLSAFIKAEGVTGSNSSGIAGRAGIALRF